MYFYKQSKEFMRIKELYILLIIFSLSSCGIFDGSDTIESSIFFKRPNLITAIGQGGNEHRIKDLWITVDQQDLGVWPINSTVPFLPVTDPTTIRVNAGVRNNGSFTSSITYPFYGVIVMEKNLVENAVDTMTLDFRYTDVTKFSFIEDFEGNHIFTKDEDDDPESEVTIEQQNGSNVAVLNVKPEHEILDVSTSIGYFDVVGTNNFAFLELEYKSETTFTAGVVAISDTGEEGYIPFIFLKESPEWNKVYLDLSSTVQVQNVESFRVRFTLQSSSATADETIYIDNVKLVHF